MPGFWWLEVARDFGSETAGKSFDAPKAAEAMGEGWIASWMVFDRGDEIPFNSNDSWLPTIALAAEEAGALMTVESAVP